MCEAASFDPTARQYLPQAFSTAAGSTRARKEKQLAPGVNGVWQQSREVVS